jgi:hypothetical protein
LDGPAGFAASISNGIALQISVASGTVRAGIGVGCFVEAAFEAGLTAAEVVAGKIL